MTYPGERNRRRDSPGRRDAVRHLGIPLAMVVGPVGCSGSGSDEAEVAVDMLGNGTVVVRNSGDGVWASGRAWRLEGRMRIGSADAGSPDAFGSIWALALDDLGRLYVADETHGEIRVFDLDGGHVRRFSRKGEGPGELSWVAGLGVEGDRVWAID